MTLGAGCSSGNSKASPGSSAKAGSSTTGAPPSSIGEQVSGTAAAVPDEFPTDVPLPSQKPVVAFSNTAGVAKTFDLTYTGSNLESLVADVRRGLADSGFTFSGDYNAKVKGVPSAGFVARSDKWVVTVGGVFTSGKASVHVSVISA